MKNWKTWLGTVIIMPLGAALVAGGDGWIDMLGSALLYVGGVITSGQSVVSAASRASRSAKLWVIGLGLCAAVVLAGCQTVNATVETARDWRTAGEVARAAVPLFVSQSTGIPVDTAGWTESDIIAAAVRDGACAMVYGILASDEERYLDRARYGMQVAAYWVAGRYPALGRSWLDLLLEHRASIEYAVGRLGNTELDLGVRTLLAWLDAQGHQKSIMLPLLLRPAV